MKDVTDVIVSAFNLYKENYRKIITAFIAIIAISVLISLLYFPLRFSLSLNEMACDVSGAQGHEGNIVSSAASNMLCETLKFTSLIEHGLDWITALLVLIVILSVMKPLEEIVSSKKQVSEWTSHISFQLSNSIKLFVFDTLIGLVTFVPTILLLLIVVPDAVSLFFSITSGQGSEELIGPISKLVLKSFAVLIIGVLTGALLGILCAVLFTFVHVELALENKGIISAARSSVELFRNNMGQVILFHIIWLLIGIVAAVMTFLTCCMAFFVAPIVSYLMILPVRLLSEIILWKELKSNITVTAEIHKPPEDKPPKDKFSMGKSTKDDDYLTQFNVK